MYIKSVKSTWVKRLLTTELDTDWKHIYNAMLNSVGGNLLFELMIECYTKETDLNWLYRKQTFLFNVVNSWMEIKYNINVVSYVSSDSIIWNNSDIKIDGVTVYIKDWHDRGIKFVDQLYDFRVKSFYSFENAQFIWQLPNNDFLKYYNSLIKNIPQSYHNFLKDSPNLNRNNTVLIDKVLRNKHVNKILYANFTKDRKY